jgi:hypothetical protein
MSEHLKGSLEELTELHDWMRKHGARSATLGHMKLELGPIPQPAREAKALNPEDEAKMRHEARRRRYELEFGRPVTDEQLERLP